MRADCSPRNRTRVRNKRERVKTIAIPLPPSHLKKHSSRTRRRLIVLFAHITRYYVSFLSAAKICKYHLQLSARNPRLTPTGKPTARRGGGTVLTEVFHHPPQCSNSVFMNFRVNANAVRETLCDPAPACPVGIFHPPIVTSRKKECDKERKFQLPLYAYTIGRMVRRLANVSS